MSLIKCHTCNELKPIENFYFDKGRGRYRTQCKDCTKKVRNIWVEKNRKKYLHGKVDRHLYRKYGIISKEYDNLFKSQGGRCAICGILSHKTDRGLFIDHDHDTDKIRGLLCNKCNRGLGHFNDDPELTSQATVYLLKNEGHGE